LWALGCVHQVICVTHLPQIAAYGDSHFFVHKEEMGGRTVSRLDRLDDRSRLAELAAMLGGGSDTPESQGNAAELMSSADGWKRRQSAKRPTEGSKRPG
jgi:DNA repair protein RecN (Recombination protein N)